MTLPLEIEQSFKAQSESGTICASCRSLNSLSGDLGETYIITDEANLYLFSRRVGETIEEHCLPVAAIEALEVVEDRPFAHLKVRCAAGDYSLKFSAMDEGVLQSIAALKHEGAEASPPAPAKPPTALLPAAAGVEFDPLVAFCAAIYALIQVDGNIDPEELILLNRQVDSPETVARGLEYLRRVGTVRLVEQLSHEYDQSQKLCLIANMLEISMVDGVLRSTEKGLMKQFREAMGIQPDDYEAIFEIILVKNNLTVFQSK